MAERQLRSRDHSVAREVAGASLRSEGDSARIDVNEELYNITDRQWEGLAESGNNAVMSASQFHEFMRAVTKEFEELKDRMKSENSKLAESIKAVAHEMSSKIEVANKDLSDSLTKQFREESENLKKEVTSKLKSEVMNMTEAMNRLRKDTDLEVTSIRDSVETVCETLGDKMKENMSVMQTQIDEVSQKVSQEIENLKARLADKRVSAGSSAQGVEINVSGTDHNVMTPARSASETNCSQSESACSDVANVEISHVNTATLVNASSEMPANRDSLSELVLPSFVDCNKQSVVTFLRDLDMYFELKKVPENLKLPLVLRAIKDPFAENWVSSEYHKIDSYQSFKMQFSKLFWNELEQSRVRCDIYQGKYDKSGGESMTEHYVRYARLAANLQPPLTEYDLVTALSSHFPLETQRAMLAANLRSTQEALAFLGRMQSLEKAQEAYEKVKQDQSVKEYERRHPRGREQGGGRDFRETPREVRHVRYGYRQNNPGTPHRRNTSDRRHSYHPDRRNTPQTQELNPRIPEFRPRNTHEGQGPEQTGMRAERFTANRPNQEN